MKFDFWEVEFVARSQNAWDSVMCAASMLALTADCLFSVRSTTSEAELSTI